MEEDIKVNTKKIIDMDMGLCIMVVIRDILGNGKMGINMVKGYINRISRR